MNVSVVLFATLMTAAVVGCEKKEHHHRESSTPSEMARASPDRLPAGVNAMQNEMRLLVEAMRTSVTAIGYGSLDAIPESLHTVHRARELTEKALEHGEYRLAKNPDRAAVFKALDEEFHGELEKLLAVARSRDATKTGAQVGAVMARCAPCHDQFRP